MNPVFWILLGTVMVCGGIVLYIMDKKKRERAGYH